MSTLSTYVKSGVDWASHTAENHKCASHPHRGEPGRRDIFCDTRDLILGTPNTFAKLCGDWPSHFFFYDFQAETKKYREKISLLGEGVVEVGVA